MTAARSSCQLPPPRIAPVRIFVLALAILLLPLRGWLGDGMSVAMAMQAVQSMAVASSGGAHDAHQAHELHGAHAGHGTSAALAAQSSMTEHTGHDSAQANDMSGDVVGVGKSHMAGSAGAASHDCQTTQHGCSDCQLCHSVAVTVWPEVVALVAPPASAPASARAAFASAEPAPGFKPPIS